jgi:hypothetical protein
MKRAGERSGQIERLVNEVTKEVCRGLLIVLLEVAAAFYYEGRD